MGRMLQRLIGLAALGAFAGSPAQAGPAVIPLPARMEAGDGQFELASATVVVAEPDGAEIRSEAERLAARLRPATGYVLPVSGPGERPDPVIRLVLGATGRGEEGYQLEVAPHEVLIRAETPAGLFYGGQTLRQLLPTDIFSPARIERDTWAVPCVTIEDQPRFRWRGLHLDVGRHFMPKEFIEKLIDLMALHKLNTFHWHLTDDQGWRIEIKKYPKLTEVGAWRDETLVGHIREYRSKKIPMVYDGKRHGGFYTQEEIRDIVRYAAERHVTIVPEIDMPGHMQAAVASYPELGCTDEKVGVKREWGISREILNPEESTVRFMQDVLAEVMDLFPGEFVHIGGDEARKNLWEQSERIQQLREERGLKDMHEMQSWFIKQMDNFLTANGRRLIGWDEIAEGGLAKNAAVMWWRGKAGREGTAIARKAAQDGHDIVIASNARLYFDYYQSRDKENEPLAIGGFLPLEAVYAFDPDIEGLTEEERERILGAQAQLWTEYMPDDRQVEYMAFPRATALAEIVWTSSERKDYGDFLRRLDVQLERLERLDVNYRKPNHGT